MVPSEIVERVLSDMAARNITLRFGRLTDAAGVALMSRELIESVLGWSWTPERVARSIRDRDTVTLIGADGERIIAFAIMHFGDEQAHLNLLAVRPSHQRTGLGTRLVDWLMESAGGGHRRDAGVSSNDEARRFYLARIQRVVHSGVLPRPRNGSPHGAGTSPARPASDTVVDAAQAIEPERLAPQVLRDACFSCSMTSARSFAASCAGLVLRNRR